MKEIAVVSKNKSLLRLAELEVLSCGALPRLFSAPPKEPSRYALVVIDSDTVDVNSLGDEKNLLIVGENGHNTDSSYPPSLRILREAIVSAENGKVFMQVVAQSKKDNILYLDEGRGGVIIDGERYQLSEYEIRLLKRLCESCDTSVSRAELNSLLGAVGGNIADVYICRLRKKLEAGGTRKVIYTTRGSGYMTKYKMILK